MLQAALLLTLASGQVTPVWRTWVDVDVRGCRARRVLVDNQPARADGSWLFFLKTGERRTVQVSVTTVDGRTRKRPVCLESAGCHRIVFDFAEAAPPPQRPPPPIVVQAPRQPERDVRVTGRLQTDPVRVSPVEVSPVQVQPIQVEPIQVEPMLVQVTTRSSEDLAALWWLWAILLPLLLAAALSLPAWILGRYVWLAAKTLPRHRCQTPAAPPRGEVTRVSGGDP